MLVDVDIAGQGLVDAPPPVWVDDGWTDPITNPDWLLEDSAARAADPIEQAVADLRAVDAAMARVLRAVADASPRNGLSVRRQLALLAGATGTDVGFLDRAVEVLRAMPHTQAAFDQGHLSWSQVRGIVLDARRLTIAQRRVLDEALIGTIAQGRDRGEPDRVVEICGDLVARLDAAGQERLEESQERAQRLIVQLGFDGWGELHGLLDPTTTASITNALDALADAPVAPDAPPATDDDGRVLPAVAQPPRSRSAQWAIALGRMAALALGGANPDGTLGRARPLVHVIAPIADLLADEQSANGVGSMTARLLLRRGNGRRRITRALTRALADDANLVSIFTDEQGMPVAIGDSFSPITPALRRAVLARDQGCRAPGCSAPVEHCDVHHVIPREQGGPTEIGNLAAFCRSNHTSITRHRWAMTLRPDATLTVRIGRHTYTTRPRLRAPVTAETSADTAGSTDPTPDLIPPPGDGRQPRGPDQPVPF